MSYPVYSLARRALIAAAAGVLAVGTIPVAAADTVDELMELNLRAWNGEPELVAEIYAPEAVHTATFYDLTTEYVGPESIADVARYGGVESIGPRIDIPAAEGEWRYAGFASLGGGTACLFRAVDGIIVRHDCVLPEESRGYEPRVGLADAETSAAIDQVEGRLQGSWGRDATVESLGEVYAPDAVHSARYLNRTRTYTGLDEIQGIASRGSGNITQLGERVDFASTDGELAWAEVVDVAGGSVCLFRAVDGLITRHDCVLPVAG